MTIVVLGATGKLGRQVLRRLWNRGAAGSEIIAAGRDLAKLSDQDSRAVRVDYDDPASLRVALRGADRALLISGTEPGRRVTQHAAAIDAAHQAGVGLLALTSTPNATGAAMSMAEDHAATEALLRDSGIPFVILRNSMYLDLFVEQTVPVAVTRGVIVGASGKGRISPASRDDLGDAAAEVLTGEGHAGAVYELGGQRSYTMDEVAAAIADRFGTAVEYRDVSAGEFKDVLLGQGVPERMAELFADTQLGIARGEMFVDTGDLSRLIGRPTQTLDEALAKADLR
ncbi:NAD(P)H-binding protein [Nonomuraea sp. NPDC049695]|uniref:NAD(P)H-binding protein n=1 Tax=Nonomuraea sp. NPDC049695 TaxID=3154734 RepID=UPI00343F05CD